MKSHSVEIHSTAQVSSSAELDTGVTVGPYAIIRAGVEIGKETQIGPFTVIEGPTQIGRRNRFYGQASVGTDPQDLKYAGEKTFLTIGDDNVVREFVTINRGTAGGGGHTRIGNRNLLMTGVHVAHDCLVGNDIILANSATLAGHVEILDHASVGAFCAVHQFCRVGRYAFIGGFSVLTRDILPFVKTVGIRGEARTYGVNTIGLERKGFSGERLDALRTAYRILFNRGLKLQEGIERVRREVEITEDVEELLEFIEASERGFVR